MLRSQSPPQSSKPMNDGVDRFTAGSRLQENAARNKHQAAILDGAEVLNGLLQPMLLVAAAKMHLGSFCSIR